MSRTAGDALLAAAFVGFASGSSPETRARLWDRWHGILRARDVEFTPGLSPSETILGVVQGEKSSQDALVAAMASEGLPAGDAALASALVIGSSVSALRVPMIVDPNLQCLAWLLRSAGVAASAQDSSAQEGGQSEDAAAQALEALRGGSDSAVGLRSQAIGKLGVHGSHGAVLRFVWEAISANELNEPEWA